MNYVKKTNIPHLIEDNYLEEFTFDVMKGKIVPQDLEKKKYDDQLMDYQPIQWTFIYPQVYEDYIPSKDKESINSLYNWNLSHTFYIKGHTSPSIGIIKPLIDKIDLLGLYRIKANLTIKHPTEQYVMPFHVDREPPPKNVTMFTSIFYMNTNNGFTELEDGTRIDAVENRLLTFPADTYHAGSYCTDEFARIVINLNYFKDMKLK